MWSLRPTYTAKRDRRLLPVAGAEQASAAIMTALDAYECPVTLSESGVPVLESLRDAALFHDGGPYRIERFQVRDARIAHQLGGEAALRLLHDLAFYRIADARTCFVAIERLRSEPGKAPGPDGIRLEELSESASWDLARTCARAMFSGEYQCGNDRIVQIPKPGKPGQYRPIHIRCVADRVAGKAITLIARPGCELIFSDRSFGFRRGRNREDALATALRISRAENRWHWVCVDIEKAFERIPRGRLRQVLARLFPDNVIDLVFRLIGDTRGRGVPMGGSESPLLANLYLDRHLDRPWLQEHLDMPLLRYADDLLVLCKNAEEAQAAFTALQKRCRSIGMPLKKGGTPCLDMLHGDVVSYLGFAVQLCNDGPRITLPVRAINLLEEKLVRAYLHPLPAIHAIQLVRGWLAQQGPAYRDEDIAGVLARLRQGAGHAGFDELPTDVELSRIWSQGHERWVQRRSPAQPADQVTSPGDDAVEDPEGLQTEAPLLDRNSDSGKEVPFVM